MVLNGKISKHKYWEIQAEMPSDLADLFGFNIELSSKRDHAGFRFEVELFRFIYFHLWIYDNRHWDYENDRWVKYPD